MIVVTIQKNDDEETHLRKIDDDRAEEDTGLHHRSLKADKSRQISAQ